MYWSSSSEHGKAMIIRGFNSWHVFFLNSRTLSSWSQKYTEVVIPLKSNSVIYFNFDIDFQRWTSWFCWCWCFLAFPTSPPGEIFTKDSSRGLWKMSNKIWNPYYSDHVYDQHTVQENSFLLGLSLHSGNLKITVDW